MKTRMNLAPKFWIIWALVLGLYGCGDLPADDGAGEVSEVVTCLECGKGDSIGTAESSEVGPGESSEPRVVSENQTKPQHGKNLDRAENLCLRIPYADLYDQCMAYVERATFFSDDAIDQCSRITLAEELKKCIQFTANKAQQANAVLQCSRLTDGTNLYQCMYWIGNARFETKAIKQCARINEAEPMIRCLRHAANSRYDDKVLVQCTRHRYNSPLVDCMGVTRNKVYTEREVRTCSRITESAALNQCLRRRGRSRTQ